MIGYYGGTEAKGLTYGAVLQDPSIVVRNADTLTVTVTDPNTDGNRVLQLIIQGKTSGAVKTFTLDNTAVMTDARVSGTGTGTGTYAVVLDDITNSFCRADGR